MAPHRYPPDPNEPRIEIYRMLPPRREPPAPEPPPRWRMLAGRARPASRRALWWAWGLTTATLAVVLGSVIYGWLSRR